MSKVLKTSFIFILIIQNVFLHGQIANKIPLDKSQQINYAQTLIKDLRNGFLIVRLQYKNAQVKYYTGMIENKLNIAKDISYAQSELSKITSKRDSFNVALISAIDSVYRFSKVRFIYDKDYSTTDINQNNKSFLNKQLEMDPILSIGDSKFLLMGYMDVTASSGRSSENFKAMTPDFSEVPKYIQVPGTSLFLNMKADYGKQMALKAALIKKMKSYNMKLQKFYDKSVARNE